MSRHHNVMQNSQTADTKITNKAQNINLVRNIQVISRLIKYQKLWFLSQRTSQHDTLFLAT